MNIKMRMRKWWRLTKKVFENNVIFGIGDFGNSAANNDGGGEGNMDDDDDDYDDKHVGASWWLARQGV